MHTGTLITNSHADACTQLQLRPHPPHFVPPAGIDEASESSEESEEEKAPEEKEEEEEEKKAPTPQEKKKKKGGRGVGQGTQGMPRAGGTGSKLCPHLCPSAPSPTPFSWHHCGCGWGVPGLTELGACFADSSDESETSEESDIDSETSSALFMAVSALGEGRAGM